MRIVMVLLGVLWIAVVIVLAYVVPGYEHGWQVEGRTLSQPMVWLVEASHLAGTYGLMALFAGLGLIIAGMMWRDGSSQDD